MPRRPRYETYTGPMKPRGGGKILYSRDTRTGKVSGLASLIEGGPLKGIFGIFTKNNEPVFRIKRK